METRCLLQCQRETENRGVDQNLLHSLSSHSFCFMMNCFRCFELNTSRKVHGGCWILAFIHCLLLLGMSWIAGMRLWPVAKCNALGRISAMQGPTRLAECPLWLVLAHPYLGWCWQSFLCGSSAKFSPLARSALNNVIKWVITPVLYLLQTYIFNSNIFKAFYNVFICSIFLILFFSDHLQAVTTHGWRAWKAVWHILSASLHPRPAATCLLTPTKWKINTCLPSSPSFAGQLTLTPWSLRVSDIISTKLGQR